MANVKSNYQQLKNNANTQIFYVPHDLYGRYLVKKINSKAKLISRMNSERVIFSVLKNPNHLGLIFKDDLGLIPNYLNQKLVIYDRLNVGHLYLLVGPSLLNVADKLQGLMLAFHENWHDPNEEYFYLNFYRFEKWKNDHKKGMHVSDDFQDFLEIIQVK